MKKIKVKLSFGEGVGIKFKNNYVEVINEVTDKKQIYKLSEENYNKFKSIYDNHQYFSLRGLISDIINNSIINENVNSNPRTIKKEQESHIIKNIEDGIYSILTEKGYESGNMVTNSFWDPDKFKKSDSWIFFSVHTGYYYKDRNHKTYGFEILKRLEVEDIKNLFKDVKEGIPVNDNINRNPRFTLKRVISEHPDIEHANEHLNELKNLIVTWENRLSKNEMSSDEKLNIMTAIGKFKKTPLIINSVDDIKNVIERLKGWLDIIERSITISKLKRKDIYPEIDDLHELDKYLYPFMQN